MSTQMAIQAKTAMPENCFFKAMNEYLDFIEQLEYKSMQSLLFPRKTFLFVCLNACFTSDHQTFTAYSKSDMS